LFHAQLLGDDGLYLLFNRAHYGIVLLTVKGVRMPAGPAAQGAVL
jgi:hypothetical protein